MPNLRKALHVVRHNIMPRILFIILTVFFTTQLKAQGLTFLRAVDSLYFGVDVNKFSSSLLDSLVKVKRLHHADEVIRQSNLNLNIQLQTDKQVWSSKHTFIFTESPLPNLKIDSGFIFVTTAQVDSVNKLIDLKWEIQFDTKTDAIKYLDRLKELFSNLSTTKKYEETGKDELIIRFSKETKIERDISEVTFILNKSALKNKYQILFFFGIYIGMVIE